MRARARGPSQMASSGGYSKPQWSETPSLEQFARQHSVDLDYEHLRVDRFLKTLRQTKGNAEASLSEAQFVYAAEELWYAVSNLREFTTALERMAAHQLGNGARLESSTRTLVDDNIDGRRARDVTIWTLKIPIRRNSFFSLQQFLFNANFAFFLLAISVFVGLVLLASKQAEL